MGIKLLMGLIVVMVLILQPPFIYGQWYEGISLRGGYDNRNRADDWFFDYYVIETNGNGRQADQDEWFGRQWRYQRQEFMGGYDERLNGADDWFYDYYDLPY